MRAHFECCWHPEHEERLVANARHAYAARRLAIRTLRADTAAAVACITRVHAEQAWHAQMQIAGMFFAPALADLCVRWHVPPRTAAALFVALANGAPDLASTSRMIRQGMASVLTTAGLCECAGHAARAVRGFACICAGVLPAQKC